MAATRRPAAAGARPEWHRLSDTGRETYGYVRCSIAALARARAALVAGESRAAGVPAPQFLIDDWSGAAPAGLRTLQRAFAEKMTPGERAYWKSGEAGRRAADTYRPRSSTPCSQVSAGVGASLSGAERCQIFTLFGPVSRRQRDGRGGPGRLGSGHSLKPTSAL
ncbi:hypothetical protein [Actinoplanes sp. L3-i22]|uniref:hypothetical protein n=1 Tax=Actinoplanes sp. L3-i22 TaxID=2836373 RepID=UPI001C75375E|nr:hypothetical protein [Actinoplanes sp. L3-i22]BCY10918.1 hypothetical protein L3i22_060060 [Actinoplanes sp. L3-i22]